jgi:hypothetical protein
MGGYRAYKGRLWNDRSPRHSCRSIVSANYASPREAGVHNTSVNHLPLDAKLLQGERPPPWRV